MKLKMKEEIQVFLDTLDTYLHTTCTVFKYMYIHRQVNTFVGTHNTSRMSEKRGESRQCPLYECSLYYYVQSNSSPIALIYQNTLSNHILLQFGSCSFQYVNFQSPSTFELFVKSNQATKNKLNLYCTMYCAKSRQTISLSLDIGCFMHINRVKH